MDNYGFSKLRCSLDKHNSKRSSVFPAPGSFIKKLELPVVCIMILTQCQKKGGTEEKHIVCSNRNSPEEDPALEWNVHKMSAPVFLLL